MVTFQPKSQIRKDKLWSWNKEFLLRRKVMQSEIERVHFWIQVV